MEIKNSENKKSKISFFILLSTFYFLFSVLAVQAATLYLSPASGDFTVGGNFTVAVYVSSPDQAMNAVQGTVTFPLDKLEVVSLPKSASIVNLWVQNPRFSNKTGAVQFEGLALNPGFTGSAGKLLSITFRAKQTGRALLEIANSSVLANDGLGTNILTSVSGGKYTLLPKKTEPLAPTPSTTPTSSLPLPAEPIAAPKITNYSPLVYLPREALLIEGTAIPNTQIVLYLQKDSKSKIVTFETASDEKGKWQAFYQEGLEKGQWWVSAVAKDKEGAFSSSTEVLPIQVDSWFNYVIRFILKYFFYIIILIVVLFCLLVYFIYRRFRKKQMQKKSEKDIQIEKDNFGNLGVG